MSSERSVKRRRVSPPEGADSVPGFAKWNIEQDYEKRPRKNKKEESSRLPIKRDGRIVQQLTAELEDEPSENEEDAENAGEEDGDRGIADVKAKSEPPKPRLSPKQEIFQAKEELARIAGVISEEPDEHIGLLRNLEEFASAENATVRKLGLGTQLAVYKDIIPGYRIRPLSTSDLQAKLSKDVRKLRNFEQGLLSGYKDYVATLGRLAKQREKRHESSGNLSSVAMACACTLLTSVPHFNCRNDLIAMLVNKLSSRAVDQDFVKARETLKQLFRDDEEGHTSLEAVSQLTKMMKGKNFNIHESVLNTFLHLRLLSEFAHKASTNRVDNEGEQNKAARKAKNKKEFRTKREKKVMRERKEVEKEMQEADAVVSYEERDKNQAETLKLVFVAYFRILKSRSPPLMGAVLEGLAKYAHLINQDFFGDVLEALKDLINDATASLDATEDATDEAEEDSSDDESSSSAASIRSATRESLLCIITAFALLQGQQDVAKSATSLHLDLNFFITHLYRNLHALALDADIELSGGVVAPASPSSPSKVVNLATTTVLLLRSLHAILLPPTATKSVPPLRLAAFSHQLLTLTLHTPAKSSLALLGLLERVSKVHGARIAALWNSEERRGDGVFDPVRPEVEGSNPFAGTVWEGELLRVHFDPRVREGVRGVEKNVLASR